MLDRLDVERTKLVLRRIMLDMNDIPYDLRTKRIIELRSLIQKEYDRFSRFTENHFDN